MSSLTPYPNFNGSVNHSAPHTGSITPTTELNKEVRMMVVMISKMTSAPSTQSFNNHQSITMRTKSAVSIVKSQLHISRAKEWAWSVALAAISTRLSIVMKRLTSPSRSFVKEQLLLWPLVPLPSHSLSEHEWSIINDSNSGHR